MIKRDSFSNKNYAVLLHVAFDDKKYKAKTGTSGIN